MDYQARGSAAVEEKIIEVPVVQKVNDVYASIEAIQIVAHPGLPVSAQPVVIGVKSGGIDAILHSCDLSGIQEKQRAIWRSTGFLLTKPRPCSMIALC